MKSTQKKWKLLLLLALAAIMVFAAALPALAAEGDETTTTYTITINNGKNLPDMTTGQFVAYQIFEGRLTENDKDTMPSEEGGQALELADIDWGTGVNSDALLTALAGATDPALKGKFASVVDAEHATTDKPKTTAAEIAKILSENKGTAFLQAFAKVLTGTGILTDKGTPSKVANEGKSSTITVENPGYYLIVDKVNTGSATENAVVAQAILAVLGNQEINLKADVPTVDKDIVKDNTGVKGDVAGIGDIVTFKLTGTLPANYGAYEVYTYVFHDTMSAGLTYNSDVKVYIKPKTYSGNDYGYELTANDYFVVTGTDSETGGTTLKVEIGKHPKFTDPVTNIETEATYYDVKQISDNRFTIDAETEIIVVYTATVNEFAKIGAKTDGTSDNWNKVKLNYSNNPNDKGDGTTPPPTGDTPEEKVYVFSFGLDLTKIGSDQTENKGLTGAGFVLSKTVTIETDNGDGTTTETTKTLYAQFQDKTVDGKTYRQLSGWTDVYKNGDTIIDACLLTSGNGGKFYVEGLDEGTYTLKEVKTPSGYNTMEDVSFTITAEYNYDTDGNITGLKSVTFEFGDEESVTYTAGDTSNNVFTTGLLPATLENQRALKLPFTGGAGAILFYVLGTLLLAGAGAYIVVSKRKAY